MGCPGADRVLAFVERRLDPGAAQAFEAHAAECAECRVLLSELARSSLLGVLETAPSPGERAPGPDLAAGATVGRYVIAERLGAGGMGVVYAAHDPELDRRTAIKLLHPEIAASEAGRGRLLREARAMAKLAHPNVIAAHDVGTFGAQVFVAMELVEGETLSRWLASAPRSADEVRAVFAQAGRGLLAAHRVQIVHRDFKPENVLCGRDGRVRVTDFGLASSPPVAPSDGAPRALALTQSGQIVGTPAYMAPEQFRGEEADARSDQFAFCVSLWQGLYGERPFRGETIDALHAQVEAGPPSPPRRRGVSSRLKRAIARGLQPRPEARFATLEPLLAELERDPRRTRRRLGAVAAAIALAATAAGAAWVRAQRRPAELCRGAEQRLAGVWDGERRAAVEGAFQRSGRGYAGVAARSVAAALDRWAAAWSAARIEACRETRVRGEQSEELLDLRMQCYDRELEEARALVGVLASADGAVVDRAVQAAGSLSPPSECENSRVLTAPVRPPREGEAAAKVAATRTELARVKALVEAGRYPEADRLAAHALDAARPLGYPPLEAEALYWRGETEERVGEIKGALPVRRQAVAAAERSRHDLYAVRAWMGLEKTLTSLARFDEARGAADLAEAALQRVGGAPELAAKQAGHRCAIDADEARFDDLARDAARAVALSEQALGHDSLDAAIARGYQGSALARQGRSDEAIAAFEDAVARLERSVGAEHPAVAYPLNSLGAELLARGRFAESLAAYHRATVISEAAKGPDHVDTAVAIGNEAMALDALGERTRALELSEREARLLEAALGPDHPRLAAALLGQAYVEMEEKRLDQAAAHIERAVRIRERALGPEHFDLASALLQLGSVRELQHRYADSLAADRRALAIAERAAPKDPLVMQTAAGVGRELSLLGRPREGLPLLERAVAICRASPCAPMDYAVARFDLARARYATGGDRAAARALAAEAAAALAKDPQAEDDRREAEAWLKAHPR